MAHVGGLITRALRVGESRRLRSYEKRAKRIGGFEPEMEIIADGELRTAADSMRERARNGEPLEDLLPEAFALTREAARRSLGQRHYDVQLIGGMALHDGAIAEMKTGEGKTLTATLAVFLNTLAGGSVHVVTVNDYLARRDAELMKPIYDSLGVTVAAIQEGDDDGARQAKYACEVVYGTNYEFGFDYLHDNLADDLGKCVQRGHHFAIVDEIDSILIDIARTPLIIAGEPEGTAPLYSQFAQLAREMRGVPSKLDLLASKDTSKADYDYEFDEKHWTVAPTERGVRRAEDFLGVDNLYLSEHGGLVNHLMQALLAESLCKRDREYIVVDGEVVIVDRSTGRRLEDQHWSEGLHQAVQAKEGLEVTEEDPMVATITLQNYFRLYEKLSGMTGTALTEAHEFMKTYKAPVVEIPTNRPIARIDHEDRIFETKKGKWQAVLEEVAARHETGQPILVGTASVATSERISVELSKRGIEHSVLNAKPEHAQREGEIISQAGRMGAVTIATNMAGRGVDIKLGGDSGQLAAQELKREELEPTGSSYAEALAAKTKELELRCTAEAEKIRGLGGLYVCGTERHESRRIDDQLRGRSGRQGDPGETRFFVSTEDEVIRFYAGHRISRALENLGPEDEFDEEAPFGDGLLAETVEGAQRKVEEENFLARRDLLKYDNILNEQRRVIYEYRRQILEGRDISDAAREGLEEVIERLVDEYAPGDEPRDWDLRELKVQLRQIWSLQIETSSLPAEKVDREKLKDELDEDAMRAYNEKEDQVGEDAMRELERRILLGVISARWQDHLRDMEYLNDGIHLRGFADDDPLVAYKNEGYTMFQALIHSIWKEFSTRLFNSEFEIDASEAGIAFGSN
ncbi:MAG TPA: preprotein translocase subunit SecA [Actinomycetota bacterium]|nr:preprotein translocase subunit SecA [Actinomycetota bacterium]